MKKKLLITTIAITSALTLNGCDYNRYLKIPCDYPVIEKVHKPKKEHIKGYTKCRALIHGKWVFIGRCIDYKNTLILKTQNKKQLRVITAYENKIDKYTKEYTTNTKGVKLWDIN